MTKLTSYWKRIAPLFVYFLLNNVPTYGQGVIQSTRFPEEKKVSFFINKAFSTLGQSFTATQTGKISSISITLDERLEPKDFNKQVKLWLGKNPSTGDILTGTPLQVVTLSDNTENGALKLVLDKPFSVIKGQVYRMQFGHTSANNSLSYLFRGSIKNPYPNGQVYFHNGMPQVSRDLEFAVAIN